MDSADRDYLTTSEVASRLRVHRATVLRIPPAQLRYEVTPGGQRRYTPSDVEAYAAALKRQ